MKSNPHHHNRPGSRLLLALIALAKPATRMHKYRNLHRIMFYDSMCQMDCKDC